MTDNDRYQGLNWLAFGLLLVPTAASAQQRPLCSEITTRVLSETRMMDTSLRKAVPVEIWRPAARGKYPRIVFSVGAYASPDRYRAITRRLAEAGYVVVTPTPLDAEALALKPTQAAIWQTRNQEVVAALALKIKGADPQRVAAMGHSYGALTAQMAVGAVATGPENSASLVPQNQIKAIVAWSPPGPYKGLVEPAGWSSITKPMLTITGTTDILPGFNSDWQVHRVAHDNTPKGKRWLWVGAGVNHYFGGVFGREKAADAQSVQMFNRAMATSIAFFDEHLKPQRKCQAGSLIDGEVLEVDP